MNFAEWWQHQRLMTSVPLPIEVEQLCHDAFEAGYACCLEDTDECLREQVGLDAIFDAALAITRKAVQETP